MVILNNKHLSIFIISLLSEVNTHVTNEWIKRCSCQLLLRQSPSSYPRNRNVHTCIPLFCSNPYFRNSPRTLLLSEDWLWFSWTLSSNVSQSSKLSPVSKRNLYNQPLTSLISIFSILTIVYFCCYYRIDFILATSSTHSAHEGSLLRKQTKSSAHLLG